MFVQQQEEDASLQSDFCRRLHRINFLASQDRSKPLAQPPMSSFNAQGKHWLCYGLGSDAAAASALPLSSCALSPSGWKIHARAAAAVPSPV